MKKMGFFLSLNQGVLQFYYLKMRFFIQKWGNDMSNFIIFENQKKIKNYPFWMLLCFSMFCFWQMGFIYFMGPSLTINGRTPLPISMDNITTLIALSYVFSILFMIFLPSRVIWAQRISTVISMATAIGLFLPLPDEALRMLIYAHVFFCCFMIGFETFLMINYFSEENTVTHLTAAYGVSLILISIVQNDFIPITFPVFRIITVIALILLFVFFFRMPAKKELCPRYVKKNDEINKPEKLLIGTFVLVFVSAVMAVSGPSISGEVKHGVFITYLVDAIASLLIYFIYKKFGIHPFRLISICIGMGSIGFLLMFAATDVPELASVACGFIGIGMLPCQMLPLYGVVLMKSYPSRFLSPIIIGLSLVAVLVQGSMVEIFRNSPSMLNLVYAVIMVALVIIYLQIEPYYLYTLKRKIPEAEEILQPVAADTEETFVPDNDSITEKKEDSVLAFLSKRELEVVDLIAGGYSNGDIAKMLYISVHTVNDHTKNIYRKLDVHSRYELTALVNKLK